MHVRVFLNGCHFSFLIDPSTMIFIFPWSRLVSPRFVPSFSFSFHLPGSRPWLGTLYVYLISRSHFR
ncbi:hypothetical protein EV356DRAFT_181537 [Viridothelium virens]|uniref:Uncharacterized protein n=1 Tax=Viridothelium virens TaxID=1048519 RepID=A0A6A6H8I5_VIRVR|nr:hypothetical protein EV356DRAFT_181537 [Viridothelium virens]